MKKIFLSLVGVVAFLSVFITSCQKDTTPTPTDKNDSAEYTPTPYTLQSLSANYYRKITIPADNPLTVEGIALGRKLFYEKKLSSNGNVSCASCHKQQFAFGDNTPTSINVAGPTKRNTMPLYNLGMMKKYFWDGRVATIRDAIKDAMNGEQHFDATSNYSFLETDTAYFKLFKKAFGKPASANHEKVAKAMEQFIYTMLSVNAAADTRAMTADEQAGFAIFMDATRGDCFHCHTDGPYKTFSDQTKIFANNALQYTGTSYQFPDNGLGDFTKNSNDNGLFKIPSLRNLSYTAPYMHDGRFQTLEQVVNFYSDSLKQSPTVDPLMEKFNNGGSHLNATEKQQLVQFLKYLDDPAFLTDSRFSAP